MPTTDKPDRSAPTSSQVSSSAAAYPVAGLDAEPGWVTPLRIVLAEPLLVANRQAFRVKVLDAIQAGNSTIVIDVGRCPYIDASGFGVLLSLAKRCATAGGSLALEHVNEDLASLLELTRIDTVLKVYLGDAP